VSSGRPHLMVGFAGGPASSPLSRSCESVVGVLHCSS
jgi:hypothetical protein